MPISKTKLKNAAIAAKSAALPKIPKQLRDQFVSGPMTGETVNAASMAFKKALIQPGLLQLQHQQLLGTVELQYVHAHLGILDLKGVQGFGQAAVQAGADKAQAQMAARAPGHVARFLRGLLAQRQQLACLAQQMFSGRREPYAFAAAFEQLGLQLLLKLLDGHRQRGLRDRQSLGRAAEVKLFGQGDEVVQQPQFHRVDDI